MEQKYEELKPCPFCGGYARMRKKNKTIINGVLRRNCYVSCLRCDARGGRVLEGNTPEERQQARATAAALWNRRTYGE